MSGDQALAFGVIGATMAMLVWGRLRYDVVALLSLLAALACGIVKPSEAFVGFGDDIVIIVGSALVVSTAISRSGIVEQVMRPVGRLLSRPSSQVPVLVAAVTVLSAFVKNVGALAIFLPIALQVSRRTGTPASRLLMPLSFGSLLGGLATLIGTSPNIIVSRVREEITGAPFGMFDYLPVGGLLALLGIAFLSLAWRLLPANRGSNGRGPFEIHDYTTEAMLPAESPFVGRTVSDLESLAEGDVRVAGIVREQRHRYAPAGHWVLYADDLLVLQGDADALRKLMDTGRLLLTVAKHPEGQSTPSEQQAVEAVVGEGSPLIGASAAEMRLRDRWGVVLLALSRRGERLRLPLRDARFRSGDLLVLQGRTDELTDVLAGLGCLPLAERHLRLGRRRRAIVPVGALALASTLVALQLVPVTIAFFAAAVLILVAGGLTLREAYDSVEWPILILLAALIPVSGALQSTGATGLVAGWLSSVAQGLSPELALTLILASAMAVTPFLNNAATVLVMAPIAAGFAERLGLGPDPFLMAVAVGAACDFLTPIGHQCNTLVMGPGGYRFFDYARLGFPLSVLVVVIAPQLIATFWPIH